MHQLQRTLLDKIWDRHVVREFPDGLSLLYVDRHLVYEVTSPQAFDLLRASGRRPWRPETILATADHGVPTDRRDKSIAGPSDRVLDFTIDEFRRQCLLNGLDDIDITLKESHRLILDFEARRRSQEPWLLSSLE